MDWEEVRMEHVALTWRDGVTRRSRVMEKANHGQNRYGLLIADRSTAKDVGRRDRGYDGPD